MCTEKSDSVWFSDTDLVRIHEITEGGTTLQLYTCASCLQTIEAEAGFAARHECTGIGRQDLPHVRFDGSERTASTTNFDKP